MIKVCPVCKKSFSVFDCHSGRYRYCSFVCRGIAWRGVPRKNKIIKKCKRCGNEFGVIPSRNSQVYCGVGLCKGVSANCPNPDVIWNDKIAYLCGFIASDGYLPKTDRRVSISNKDPEVVGIVRSCLPFGVKISVYKNKNEQLAVNFTWRNFRSWLENIGIFPHKSLTIGELNIPNMVFFHFLRGEIDGDGHVGVHKNWLRIVLWSGSECFLEWILRKIYELCDVGGRVMACKGGFRLEYCCTKAEILASFVWKQNDICLTRKNLWNGGVYVRHRM